MAFDVVIAGGGFCGLADWTVGLLFGRASAELGQLGHPLSLETYLDEVRHTDEARNTDEAPVQ